MPVVVSCVYVVEGATHRRFELADIDPAEPLEQGLMVLIEVETGVAIAEQRLSGNGRVLLPHRSLTDQGFRSQRVELTLRRHVPAHGPVSTTAATATVGPPAPAGRDEDAAADAIQRLFQQQHQRPASTTAASQGAQLHTAAHTTPDQLIAQLFQRGSSGGVVAGGGHQGRGAVLDPDDPDVQRKLYEAIQQKNLQDNLEQAFEHTPEAFGRVVMLYVPCVVNRVPITAFVDSGAQMSVMSERMAEQCGLMRLLDRRMGGVAKGVGTCKILGRVHMTMVVLGKLVLPFSITVLERQDMDFLIGLDQLKRHQMMIDLKDNCLRIDDQAIPFLSEGELPAHLRRESNGEAENDDAPHAGADGAMGSRRLEAAEAEPPAAVAAANAPPRSTPPPAPSGTPPPATTPQHPASGGHDEGKVIRLMELTNLPAPVVEEALTAAHGDEDGAASLLLDSLEE